MKQIKNMVAVAAFTLLLFNHATAGKAKDSLKSLPVELKYIGQVNSQYLFALQFTGEEQNGEYSILISDEEGYEFFSGNVKGGSFTKKFSINADVIAESVVTFTITDKKTGKKIFYRANQQQLQSSRMNIVKM